MRLHRHPRRAVGAPEHIGMFQQRAIADHLVEFLLIDKIIMLAFNFSHPRRPRGDADRERSCGSSASSARDSEVLPAPEGAASTRHKPPRCGGLFNIRHLFAQLLDHRLQPQPDRGQLQRNRLAAKRIHLAVEFLHQKIEFPSHPGGLRQQAPAPPRYATPAGPAPRARRIWSPAAPPPARSAPPAEPGVLPRISASCAISRALCKAGCVAASTTASSCSAAISSRLRIDNPGQPRALTCPRRHQPVQRARHSQRAPPIAGPPAIPRYHPARRHCASRPAAPAAIPPAAARRRGYCPPVRSPAPSPAPAPPYPPSARLPPRASGSTCPKHCRA